MPGVSFAMAMSSVRISALAMFQPKAGSPISIALKVVVGERTSAGDIHDADGAERPALCAQALARADGIEKRET